MIGSDIYNGGRYLRRWTLVDGYPRCVETALYLPDADEGVIAQTLAANRAIRAVVVAAEGYEAARRLLTGVAPEPWVPGTDAQGEPIMVENQAWTAHLAAHALVAGADSELVHMTRTRADTLDQGEAPYNLALPPLPTLDPRAETADWGDAAWVVRALTEDELSWHPLRPAAFMPKMAFAALLTDTLGWTKGQAILGMFAGTLALASDIDWIDVFTFINGDQARPGYAAQLLAEEAVTEEEVAALSYGWTRACKA